MSATRSNHLSTPKLRQSMRRRLVAYLLLVQSSIGCTTLHTVPVSDASLIGSRVEVGNRVRVTRSDLSVVTFTVTEIHDDGLEGGKFLVPYYDIRRLKIERRSAAKTAGLVVIGILIGGMLIDGALDYASAGAGSH